MSNSAADGIDLGARLRHVRRLHGLSQRALAARAGIANSAISPR
jgi:transcriptional regulator with XRE-family HTH domain